MKKYRILSLILAAAMAASAAGCAKNKEKSSSSSESSSPNMVANLEGIADVEITAAVNEEAKGNETGFKLNGVIDSGNTDDDGNKFMYLDVTINNDTDKAYELNMLNNFYLLFPDNTEAHFDIRTQLYAVQNMGAYVPSPFEIPANGSFEGIIGGFIVDPSITNFTVCFFPTQDVATDKSNVIKVDVDSSNIVTIGGAVQPR